MNNAAAVDLQMLNGACCIGFLQIHGMQNANNTVGAVQRHNNKDANYFGISGGVPFFL